MLTGPDCSRHQGVVDWAAVRRAGHVFAIIKLTDGTAYRYIDWGRANLPKVRAAGLVPGAYHWLVAQRDGAAQARVYVEEVNRLGGFAGLLAVVDVERNVDGSYPSIGTVRAFAAEFRRLVPGHPLIVYTGRWFWRDILGNPRGADLGPLWHSEYEPTLAEVDDGPELDNYGGWPGATFWQWTSSGTCPGVAGRCDLNRFYGDHTALAALTQPEDDMTPEQYRKELAAHEDRLAVMLGQSASAIVTGNPNTLADPQADGWTWLAGNPPSLADVAVGLASVDVTVDLDPGDIATLADAIVAGLGPGVATNLINELRDRLVN